VTGLYAVYMAGIISWAFSCRKRGMGGYAFVYAKGYSYLQDGPPPSRNPPGIENMPE